MSKLYDKTLVVDNRWMLIVNGLWATVVITLLSLALGTLLGGGIYAMTLSRHSWVRKMAQYYRLIVRGTPLLVLLLFFFYVVLSGGNGILAAIIAFGINFSNLACTLFQSSIDAVGRDQLEAGRALGFTTMQNWRYIVLPQALKTALPTYKYQAVAMVKSTAIVGYVAVTDLAMATENIRFDEPTSSLDPTMVGEVQGVIRMLSQEKMTMLIVTHKMRFAHDISSRVLFMYDGHIYEDGTPEQIFFHPKRPVTQAFVHRIRALTFEITSSDFDFYDMTSQIKQFCIRYSMPEKMDDIIHIVEEMLVLMREYGKPMHIEVTYSELDYTSTIVVIHQGETISPLEREGADEFAVMIIRGICNDIQTEQTNEGVKLTFKL